MGGGGTKSENPLGTLNQDISISKGGHNTPVDNLDGMPEGLLKTLHRLGSAIAKRDGLIMG